MNNNTGITGFTTMTGSHFPHPPIVCFLCQHECNTPLALDATPSVKLSSADTCPHIWVPDPSIPEYQSAHHLRLNTSMSNTQAIPPSPLQGSSEAVAARSSSASNVQRGSAVVETTNHVTSVDLNKEESSRTSGNSVAKRVEEERPTSIVLPSQKFEKAADLRSGLASPIMPDGAIQ